MVGDKTMKIRTALIGAACGLAASASAQTEVLYTTNGDGGTMTMYQGGIGTQVNTHVRGYPIAVNQSVWIGDYNGNQPNSLEYDLAGNATGGSVPYSAVNAVDATSDGSFGYELGNAFGSSGTVYRLGADLDSTNRIALFDVGTDGRDSRFVGITYDHDRGTLWISAATNIYEFDLAGNQLGFFGHSEGDGHALAYESSTGTLWTARSSTLNQYDRSGNLLQTVNTDIPAGNNWGAEFAVPAPGTLALLGLGGLVAARRRR